MMKETVPKPQFAGASEEEVLKALANSLADPELPSPLAQELARILEAYTANFADCVCRFGKVPESLLNDEPPTALERVALSMVREAVLENKAKTGK